MTGKPTRAASAEGGGPMCFWKLHMLLVSIFGFAYEGSWLECLHKLFGWG